MTGAKDKRSARYRILKGVLLLAHLLALLAFCTGVAVIYSNDNFKKGISRLDSDVYENSPAFMEELDRAAASVFDYVRYRDVFETDGETDLEKTVFTFRSGDGYEDFWDLEDVFNYAEQLGYYLDNNYRLVADRNRRSDDYQDESRRKSYAVTWRAYDPNASITEPADSYMTLEALTAESLAAYGRYAAAAKRYNTEDTNLFYYVTADGPKPYTNNSSLTPSMARTYGRYCIIDSASILPDNNLPQSPTAIEKLSADPDYHNVEDPYLVIFAVDTTYPAKDAFYRGMVSYANQRSLYFTGVIMMLAGALTMLFTLLGLVPMSGHRYAGSKEISLFPFDKRMPEQNALLMAATAVILIFFMDKTGNRVIHMLAPEKMWVPSEKLLVYAVIYLCALALFFSVLRAFKAGILWEKSFCKRLLEAADEFAHSITYARRLAVYFGGFLGINVLFVWIAAVNLLTRKTLVSRLTFIFILLFLVLFNAWMFRKLFRKAIESDKIADAVTALADGTAERGALRLEPSEFEGKEARMAGSINNISRGLQTALEDQVKSERMKADLITNVSHDIKTPLTSIINYVDLMKREDPPEPKLREYLDILDQKSQHLKNLTEDLVEASKASSGNVQIDARDIDFAELAEQANGEFEERFERRSLTLVSNLPRGPVPICADGRRLWRVLENLYSNACKYASSGSRVYVDMEKTDTTACFTIKNISSKPLNISPDELTERFVRGDVSRTTEGSGLGLFIARSLTELMGGSFVITIDGDYFKAAVEFPVIQPKAKAAAPGG